jgi:hypothetical protein
MHETATNMPMHKRKLREWKTVGSRVLVGFQVEKVTAVSQSKSNNVWISNTLYTSYT